MNKQSIAGLVLIGIILFGFSWYNSKQQARLNAEMARLDSIEQANRALDREREREWEARQAQAAWAGDSTVMAPRTEGGYENLLEAALGESLYAARTGTEQFVTLGNDLLEIKLSNKGGRIASVRLKEYNSYDGSPLYLFDESSSKFNLSFFTSQQIDTEEYYFEAVTPAGVETSESDPVKSFAYRLYTDSASYMEYVYTIRHNDYMVDFNVNFVGMENQLARTQTDFLINWEAVGYQNEKGFENENNYTTIAYHYPGDDSFEDLSTSTGVKEESITTRIEWVAFKQQFFSSILISKDGGFQNGDVRYETFEPNSGKIKKFQAQLSVPFTGLSNDYSFQFYFGPNKYRTLKNYGMEMHKLVPLGGWIINWINRWIVIPTFDFLGRYISNFGLIILLLTIFIKIIISPLTYKSYLSMAKMRVLKPEIDAINEKYPKQEDAMKKQQATMELYKNAGVSPLGGCLPLLIQLPILIAMFRFFPASIELRQESFLWADDLSAYDSILSLPFKIPFYGDHVSLFTLLMALSIVLSTKLNSANTSGSAQMPGMKMMMYMMPVFMLVWFNNYSSGLSYYYLMSNLITIGQTYGFRKIVNEEKLHGKLKEHASKPKKKSKFMQRYEEAVRQQQQAQRQQKRK